MSLAAGLVVALLACAASQAARPLRTAVVEPDLAAGAAGATELSRIRGAGASFVRISVPWAQVAPATPAATFRPRDPKDPAYQWSSLDDHVQEAVKQGLVPVLNVAHAPAWAKAASAPGVGYPQAGDLADFAHALAVHYAGHTKDVPRVRYWQLWNEPNLNTNIEPQFNGQTPVSPGIYRAMVNAFTPEVKAVSPRSVVVIGALAPYGIQQKGQPINKVLSVAPLRFMRELLCVSPGPNPHATCSTKVAFDAFSVHPYTWGDPTHTAFSDDDVAMGDLPQVQELLTAAWKLHRITASARPPLWVTEISWDTNPPDPKALPMTIQTRWTSEALYRMWHDGVAVITWFLLRDQPPGYSFQSGLYFAGKTVAADKPKPTLTAFRFPFVALPDGEGTLVWGRTPDSRSRPVVIEQQTGSGWQRVARLQASGVGIFQQVLPISERTGSLRARLAYGPDKSLPFGLAPVPDERISPFGS
jgi:hypothetical protein